MVDTTTITERSANGGSEPQTDHKNRPGGDQVYRQGDEGGGSGRPSSILSISCVITPASRRRRYAMHSKSTKAQQRGAQQVWKQRDTLCAGKIRTITAVSCCTQRKRPKACEIPRRPLSRRFYEWLLDELSESERDSFCRVLNDLYLRSKKEARAGFPEVSARLETGAGEDE